MTLPPRIAHKPKRSNRETSAPTEPNAATGGPRTPEGKAISSQNATKHGCRSKTLILRHEDPAEYEALHQSWWDQYQPLRYAEETLVKQLIDNHWFLLRATKRLEQVDLEVPENPCDWTDTHQKLLNNFTRYKTSAERAFQKSFSAVESYFRDRARTEMNALKADLLRAKIEAQIDRKSANQPTGAPAPPRKFTPLAELYARSKAETGRSLVPASACSPAVPLSPRWPDSCANR